MEVDAVYSGKSAQNYPATGSKRFEELESLTGTIHFIGIGGIGMSALARLLLARGRKVSGSDKQESPITDELKELGAVIHVGHKATNVNGACAVIVSTAITGDNPEYAQAASLKLPTYHRSELLAYLSSKQNVIAVSGTHGKTTTTGMISQVFLDCGQDPSVVVGGLFNRLKSNSHAGKGDFFVAEADESDRSHASLVSHSAVITNIEPDHLENYPGGMEQILETMAHFANKCQSAAFVCTDDKGARALLPLLNKRVVSYGTQELSPQANYKMRASGDQAFVVIVQDKELGEVQLSVPGKHNKLNALCACAVALEAGLPFADIARSLQQFGGVDRRFQHIGQVNNIVVIDDYGHHPTEVQATLDAAQQYKRSLPSAQRVVAVFQPHQPGRLRDLWNEFCAAFTLADLVLLTDVYVARGGQIEGINSERFAKEIKHENVVYLSGATADLPAKIVPHLAPGDIVLTIGAGDITSIGKPLLELLSKEQKNGNLR